MQTELTLGPVYYLWEGDKWRDFYYRIADEAPVSRVVVGETICSKRQHLIDPHMEDVVARLQAAGKEVVVSSYALVTLPRETKTLKALADDSDKLIEVNDLSAFMYLKSRPHTVGPLVNVYNAPTARLLQARGATTLCLPPELPLSSIEAIAAAGPGVELEVFAFGRLPLAISARCAHARSKGKIKDNCQFICGKDPDGLTVNTLARQPFLSLNGVQTMSYTCQSLLAELPQLMAAGIGRFRLSPQDCDMVAVAEVFRNVLDGRADADEGMARLAAVYPGVPLSNGFLYGREGAALVRQPA
ncbi:ubiquinone anaerobic biosynthesis protein UbiV [Martelella endophytica]|uniref:Ubiquinone biosynthesis protein UbiV n=1 Tax=Martelella endophytica TaxID=1486262 RepID=A0A0D5LQ30_MAREN|nr:U32 family peptidase [Martelella endophytica]AJY46045.1 protease [Martelella endophytica]